MTLPWKSFFLLACALSAYSASNLLPAHLPPEIHAWFWMQDEFQPEGYKKFINLIADNSNFNLLTTSLRAPEHQITDPATHDQVQRAVEFAHQRGLRIAFDLDVRLARAEFQKRFPDQQQWMLRVARSHSIEAIRLSDHMTAPGGEYELLQGRLLRAYEAGTLREAKVRHGEESVKRVSVDDPRDLILVAAFEYRTPDVFAPALLEFQRGIYEQYRDVKLDGGMKDEWGFPPVSGQGPRGGEFWYSKAIEEAYRKAGGEDFIRDCVLMMYGDEKSIDQRLAAANRYSRLVLQRNAEIEQDFYATVKRVFGTDAFVGTHATWGAYPTGDAFKNGYDWWWATRDYGQTDEDFPYPVRTALAKKMGKPVWFNQYYNGYVEAYYPELWRAARCGGRVNFHPLHPRLPSLELYDAYLRLLKSPAMKAESRIRLLNFISQAPIDSPVAVVFGHMAALNWLGPHFADLGVDFAESLTDLGFRADVIPSTEIESGALAIRDGFVSYGSQRYRAIVFLNSEFEPASTFGFLRQAGASKTAVFLRERGLRMPRVGEDATPQRVAQFLHGSFNPPPVAYRAARLIDGTCVIAAGEKDPAGDPIEGDFFCGNFHGRARATGVFAIRLSNDGELLALAGSDLRSVEAGRFRLSMQAPVDMVIWKDGSGEWRGVLQGVQNLPSGLPGFVKHWDRLDSNAP